MRRRPTPTNARLARLAAAARHFVTSERGDDLVEYALLTSAIGIVGVTAFAFLLQAIDRSYSSWNTAEQGLWIPNPPTK